jgi:hypothetical protein
MIEEDNLWKWLGQLPSWEKESWNTSQTINLLFYKHADSLKYDEEEEEEYQTIQQHDLILNISL